MDEMIFYDLRDSQRLTHSLSTQLARELGRKIVAGKYPQNELIEDEGALADKNHVSRTVIRDAVKILVGKGLLEVRRGIGTRVRPREKWGLLDDDVLAWHQAAEPSAELLRQLMDVRLLIEPKAARWVAEQGTDESLAEIERAQVQMEIEKGSVEDFVVADALFHRSILRAARNDFIRAMEGLVFSALIVSIQLTNRDPRENKASLPFHRAVTNAITARDGALAEKNMETLLQDAIKRLGKNMYNS